MSAINQFSRRSFLNRTALAGVAVVAAGWLPSTVSAAEPFVRRGKSRLLLSLAAYSFRDQFKDKDPARRLDMFKFVDYCADHGCAGAEVTSYYFPEDATEEYFLKLRRHAFLRGIQLSGTAIGNDFTHPAGPKRDAEMALLKKWVDRAQWLGASHIRVFAGSGNGQPAADSKRLAIGALEEACAYAGTRGVFLGLENHGGIVAEADQILDIVKAVRSPWLGINLDTGNFHTDDVYGDLARCAPYAVNVQVKTEIQPRGKSKEACDLAKCVKILRDANYQGFVALEYEAAEDAATAVPRTLDQLKPLLA